MADEHKTQADIVLHRAARKLVRNMVYDAKHTAINHFFSESGKRRKKAENVKKNAPNGRARLHESK